MQVLFTREWKDYSEGQVVEIEEGVAEHLIASGFGTNYSLVLKDRESSITQLPFKRAELARFQRERTLVLQRLGVLDQKISLIQNIIDVQEQAQAKVKVVDAPEKDKMMRRKIAKEA
jgi:hypothetical protein